MAIGKIIRLKLADGSVDMQCLEESWRQKGAEVVIYEREVLQWCFSFLAHIFEMIANQQDDVFAEIG